MQWEQVACAQHGVQHPDRRLHLGHVRDLGVRRACPCGVWVDYIQLVQTPQPRPVRDLGVRRACPCVTRVGCLYSPCTDASISAFIALVQTPPSPSRPMYILLKP